MRLPAAAAAVVVAVVVDGGAAAANPLAVQDPWPVGRPPLKSELALWPLLESVVASAPYQWSIGLLGHQRPLQAGSCWQVLAQQWAKRAAQSWRRQVPLVQVLFDHELQARGMVVASNIQDLLSAPPHQVHFALCHVS